MATLTKRDLVIALSNDTGRSQPDILEIIGRTLDMIGLALANGMDVELRNFGVFQVRMSKPRVGRNPKDPKTSFEIKPRAKVKFRCGKGLSRAVDKRRTPQRAGAKIIRALANGPEDRRRTARSPIAKAA